MLVKDLLNLIGNMRVYDIIMFVLGVAAIVLGKKEK